MKYNPNIHNRRSIRLKGYDYTRPGAYFVTICTQNRECLFGKIMNGEMKLNDAGRMVMKWRHELENKFPDIKINDFICMPNHIHFILINAPATAPVYVVVQWFKTMTTNEYIRGVKQHAWPPFPGKLWQRNYYERIIRNKTEFDKIRNYIDKNPFHWHDDKNYTDS